MADEKEGTIGSVLDPALRRPFSLLAALVSVAVFVLYGLSKMETFVDGRIELKMSAARERADEQAARLGKMEEQFNAMRDTLSEIRADVRVLRSTVEGRSGASTFPAASSAAPQR